MLAWLLLLLRSDVDAPPDWPVNLEVVVKDVSDFTTRARDHGFCLTWVVLDVDRFEGMVHFDVHELNISNAAVKPFYRCDCANCHTHSEPDIGVSDDDIFGALCILPSLFHRLDGNRVIVVCDIDAFNESIFPARVDSIRIKWERGQSLASETTHVPRTTVA